MQSSRHRPGSLKQQNKKHKGTVGKRALNKAAGGKIQAMSSSSSSAGGAGAGAGSSVQSNKSSKTE
jgi:hypothetical protein